VQERRLKFKPSLLSSNTLLTSPDVSYRVHRDTLKGLGSLEWVAGNFRRVVHKSPRGGALTCDKVSQICFPPPSQKSGKSPLGLKKPEKTPVSSEQQWVNTAVLIQRYSSLELGTNLCVLYRWGAGIGRIQRSEVFTLFSETWHDVSEREREIVPSLDLLSSRVDLVRGAKTRSATQGKYKVDPRKLNNLKKKNPHKEQQQL